MDSLSAVKALPNAGQDNTLQGTLVDASAGTVVPPLSEVVPTPENTPIPGGGSWRWNAAKPGWEENTTPYAPPAV